jgi:histidine ammonia-lyase
MALVIGDKKIAIEDVVNVARNAEKIELSRTALDRIAHCRKFVDKKVGEHAIMYGITTGIGELSEVFLPPEQIKEFQKYIVYSHAAGYGEPMAAEVTRSALVSRINVLSQGHSGCRPVVVETMRDLLNKGVTPFMCQRGSVAACGDLAPMSQMALVLMGEGEAFYDGVRMPAIDALRKAGIKPVEFEARDGLSSINGSNVITGWSALQLVDADTFTKTAEIAAAMSLDVLKANLLSMDERLHMVRGYRGAIESASNIRRLTDGSEILAVKEKKVQDAYSMRSTPQVVGTARDTYRFCRDMIETELNGVGDNPIFFPDEGDGGEVITGANFQGTPIAFPLEFMGIAVTTIAVMSERRTNRLLNKNLSVGLPAFLTEGAGMFSGMMLAQYTQGQLISESRVLSHPAATGSIPAAADQEDFVSMGMTSAIKNSQIIDHSCAVVGIELMCGTQAADFRKPLKLGKGTGAVYDLIRKYIPYMKEDRPLYGDINKMAELVRTGAILEAAESAIGKLD